MIHEATPHPHFDARHKALSEGDATSRLGEDYFKAEGHAVHYRLGHLLVTALGILTGTAALLMGIANLGLEDWARHYPAHGRLDEVVNAAIAGLQWIVRIPNPWELGLAGASAVLVLVGLIRGLQTRWLFHRYRAERYRSLSFHVMIQPVHWTPTMPSPNPWQRSLKDELDALDLLGPDGLTAIAESEEPLTLPDPSACARVDSTFVRPLIGRYLDLRLGPQIDYLEKLIERQENRWFPGAALAPVVFFVSVVFVLSHFIAESLHGEAASGVLLFVSAAIPTVWAGVRTWRSANEQERNASRSKAKLAILLARKKTLENSSGPDKPDLFLVFATLAMAENLLRNELQEWLRLMQPAEWFS